MTALSTTEVEVGMAAGADMVAIWVLLGEREEEAIEVFECCNDHSYYSQANLVRSLMVFLGGEEVESRKKKYKKSPRLCN